MTQPVSVAILAAGLGTRMKSGKAKVLHRAGGLSLIEHVVNSALELTDPGKVVAVIGHQAEQVRATVEGSGVGFAVQTQQRGTGDALRSCEGTLAKESGLLLVLYGDTPLLSAATLRKLIDTHVSGGAAATVIVTSLDDPTGYGRAIIDADGNLTAIVEQKVATEEQKRVREINSGIYCFNAGLLWKHLGEIQANPVSKEFYLTDIVEILRGRGHKVRAMLHEDSTELLGINTRVELAMVDEVFRARTVQRAMLDGVTIEQPGTVTIDASARIGQDSVIEAFAQIRGNTVIGRDCVIGAGSIIRDSALADGVQIAPYTVIGTSTVESGATIGPFARLRMNNHVGAGAHIGNFVELKNAHLGEGVKAGHLAYLGDAEIGGDTNIGAGTITCNYDGKVKHKTRIGQGAFVGSNSTLVAPAEVGARSYVAAASVVTEPVPEDALAIGRGRQVNKPGWAAKRRG